MIVSWSANGRPFLPVVRVLHEHALLSGREALVLPRSRADGILRVVVGRDDVVEVLPEVVDEARVRELQRDPHRRRVHLLHALGVDVADRGGSGTGRLRVDDAVDREDDVVGRDRLAVGELDTRTQPDVPHGGVAVHRLDRLGQHHLRALEVGGRRGQRLVKRGDADDVGVRDRVVGVDRVLGAAARGTDAEIAAGLASGGGGG